MNYLAALGKWQSSLQSSLNGLRNPVSIFRTRASRPGFVFGTFEKSSCRLSAQRLLPRPWVEGGMPSARRCPSIADRNMLKRQETASVASC
jgi:hypothetical protein